MVIAQLNDLPAEIARWRPSGGTPPPAHDVACSHKPMIALGTRAW
jgi:hypothetical protein